MKKVFLFAISALMLAGCQKDSSEQTFAGEGKIAITASVSGEVTTRADGITLTTPALADFSLKITGTNFSKSWDSLSDYRSDDERYTAGWYTVAINYGDSSKEGYNLPCFAASESVQVLDRNRTTKVAMTAKLANAIVEIKTTEAFRNYFPTYNFKLTTATNEFELEENQDEHLFIAAQKGVKIDCTCIRQSNVAEGKTETLATQTISTVAPATRYIITYDLTSVGGVTVKVTLNETVLGTIEIEKELNPNA